MQPGGTLKQLPRQSIIAAGRLLSAFYKISQPTFTMQKQWGQNCISA
jgi:hypothetical protein